MLQLFSILFSTIVLAAPAEENLIAIGQGVSSPNVTSLMNVSRGYTPENPAGVLYQGGFRGSLQYMKNGDSDIGAELGYSGKTWGLAVGLLQPGCDDCEDVTSAAFGFTMGKSLSLGFRYEDESQYALGLMFNPTGKHRLGLIGEMNDPEGPDNNINNYGVGYSYVSKKNTFAVDYSMQELENPNATNDIQILSPSYSRREGPVQVSLGYEIRQGDTNDNNDRFWMGAGFGGKQWHLAVYAAYRREAMLTLSGFF